MQNDPKILVVDDDKTNLKFLKEILEDHFQLYPVDSGEEALRVISNFRPDLVLLDIMLPGLDGYSVCQSIKEDKLFSEVKIILISAKAMLNERQKGYEAGADDYITKPFDHEELMIKIHSLLK
jgi:DNA-binding response OmpR family regulator